MSTRLLQAAAAPREYHIDTIDTQTLPKAAELTSMIWFNVSTYQLSYD